MAGAVYHVATKCENRHFIRPVLFAFYYYAMQELKEFVEKNLGCCEWDKGVEVYIKWLTVPPGNAVPNHIRLYWWILKFWNR